VSDGWSEATASAIANISFPRFARNLLARRFAHRRMGIIENPGREWEMRGRFRSLVDNVERSLEGGGRGREEIDKNEEVRDGGLERSDSKSIILPSKTTNNLPLVASLLAARSSSGKDTPTPLGRPWKGSSPTRPRWPRSP